MSERRRYYSPEYYAQLDELAERLVTPDRFGKVAVDQLVLFGPDGQVADDSLEDTQEFPAIDPNIELGEE